MPTVLLVRHGRTAANAAGTLAGWTEGVGLDDTGRAQADALAQRLAALPLAALVSSPLQRCRETAAAVAATFAPSHSAGRAGRRAAPAGPRPEVQADERLGECRYGSWTGRPLRELAKDPLWRVVQAHPSAVVFPGSDGESLAAMQVRAVSAVREHGARVAAEAGEDAVWAAFSHGDVIKAILADALGMHLDAFQRIVVDPCSVSVIRYTPLRPFVLRTNDSGEGMADLLPRPRPRRGRRAASSDAEVGGGAGAGPGPAQGNG